MKPTLLMTVLSVTMTVLGHTAIAQARDVTLAAVVQPTAATRGLTTDLPAIGLPDKQPATPALPPSLEIAIQPSSPTRPALNPDLLRQVARSIQIPPNLSPDTPQEVTLIRIPI